MTEVFRQKQIREILDEDLRANREVLKREFTRAKMYDTAFTPPSRLEELVSWNIDKQISTLQEALQNIIDNAIQHIQSISNEDINITDDNNIVNNLIPIKKSFLDAVKSN